MQAVMTSAQPQLKKLDDACQGLEAAFMKTLVSQMHKGVAEVHFGQQLGGDIYRDMFDDTLSGLLAQKQGGDMIKEMAGPMSKQVIGQFLVKQKASAAHKEVKS
jgi:Rod binding domain-containing protein